MFELQLFHQPLQQRPLDQKPPAVISWETCRRKIHFYHQEPMLLKKNSDPNWMQGLEAEAFMIRILCGLESPVIGETEILGQFKKFIDENQDHPWIQNLSRNRLQNWLTIVKEIREKHLSNLGSQSYGSYLRKNIPQNNSIHIVGAGHLTQEILPWLDSSNGFQTPNVYVRNIDKAHIDLAPIKAHFKIEPLELLSANQQPRKTFILAAPVSHEWLLSHITATDDVQQIIDLRRNSYELKSRRINPLNWLDLEDVMDSFLQQKTFLQQRLNQALAAIDVWKNRELNRTWVRPFGWDDLCS